MKVVLFLFFVATVGCVTIPYTQQSISFSRHEQFYLYKDGKFTADNLLGNTYSLFEEDSCKNLSDSKYISDFVTRLKSDLQGLGLKETKGANGAFLTIAYDCEMNDISNYKDGKISSIQQDLEHKWTHETDVAGDKIVLRQKYFDQVTGLIEGSKKSPLVYFRVTAYKEDDIMSRPIFSITMKFLDGPNFNISHWTKGTSEILKEFQVLQGKVPQKSPEVFCSYRLGMEWSLFQHSPPYSVSRVYRNSLAEKNDIRINDQILNVNNVPAKQFYTYNEKTVDTYEKHLPLNFEIRRGDRIVKKKVIPIKTCRKLN